MTSDICIQVTGMTEVLHGSEVNISLDVRFLAVIVTPNPCPRHVCLMSVTMKSMLMTIAEEFRW